MESVILGMAGLWAGDNHEISDHYTTKIGGVPDWASKEMDLKPELLICNLCGARLSLVAQVYAPISLGQLKIEERTIYILACLMQKCASNPLSWRTLRVQKCHSEILSNDSILEERHVFESTVSASETGDCFAEDQRGACSGYLDENIGSDMDLEELGRALSEAASLVSRSEKQNASGNSKSSKKKTKRKPRMADSDIPVIPCFYVYSQEEPSMGTIGKVSTMYSSLSLKENHTSLTETSDEEKWEGEQYEYDRALKADRTYLKFKKRMDICPEQCFRYSYGGQPLLAAAKLEEPGICRLCGAIQHYEMQLMPPILYFMHQAVDSASTYSPEEWDWMTVIIYTCSNSCSHKSCQGKSGGNCWTVAEESTIIQYEDLGNCESINHP